MKTLLLILALTVSASAQEWKLIKEMSGAIPKHKGLTIEFYAAEIARGDDTVKLLVRTDFPNGAPRLEGATYPKGFDPTSITRTTSKVQFNCKTLEVRFIKDSAEIYYSNGKKFKSKEPSFALASGHIFSEYFCERGEKATEAPTLQPKT